VVAAVLSYPGCSASLWFLLFGLHLQAATIVSLQLELDAAREQLRSTPRQLVEATAQVKNANVSNGEEVTKLRRALDDKMREFESEARSDKSLVSSLEAQLSASAQTLAAAQAEIAALSTSLHLAEKNVS
jgi:chromosome segregation ATPase